MSAPGISSAAWRRTQRKPLDSGLQLTARLTQFRLEDDGDIHLVLKDSSGRHIS